MKKNTWLIIGGLLVVAVLFAQFRTQAIGDPTGHLYNNLYVSVYDTKNGGITNDQLDIPVYAECTANMPDYKTITAPVWLDFCGNTVSDTSYENVKLTCSGVGGRLYKYPSASLSKPVYITNPVLVDKQTYNKPRQHPECIQQIIDFADSAGINLTRVEYVTSTNTVYDTITNTVLKNQTVYVCSNGKTTLVREDCFNNGSVSSEHSVFSEGNKWIYVVLVAAAILLFLLLRKKR